MVVLNFEEVGGAGNLFLCHIFLNMGMPYGLLVVDDPQEIKPEYGFYYCSVDS